jgi:very-short-patch-repair endonuclease
VELDGSQHGDGGQKMRDNHRDGYLQQHNVLVLRFWNDEVLINLNGVAEKIREEIERLS